MADHEALPYFTGGGGGGVRCRCGEVFAIGQTYPDTKKGRPSKKKARTMRHCWELFRAHWRPDGEDDVTAMDILRRAGLT